MNLPEEAPKLNPWPFIIGDIVLVTTAALIATSSAAPLTPLPLIAATACVCLGAVLTCIPIVLNYTRVRDAQLAALQDQLATVAQTSASAANQISIATSNFHTIAENSAKMLKHADQLPQRLQDKIAEFKTQLNEVAIAENESLEQEVNTLRASEIERLEAALSSINKTVLELSALEATARQNAIDTRNALESGRTDAVKKITDAHSHAQTALATAIDKNATTAITRIEARFAELTRELNETFAKHAQTLRDAARHTAETKAPAPSLEASETETHEAPAAAPVAVPAPKKKSPHRPPATPRNTHEQTVSAAPPPATDVASDPVETPAPIPEEHSLSETPSAKTDEVPKHEPAPEPRGETPPPPAHKTEKVETPSQDVPEPASAQTSDESEAQPAEQPSPAQQPQPRKRAAKPRAPRTEDSEPMLDLDLPPPADEYAQASPDDDGGFSSAVSADGVTRLIATSYIGIGNKLYIRGDGPGLNWEKGVPLQFISIGKWRWETHDAAQPFSFKLYKNDSVECTRIGSPKLEPGHQHEVTANF